MNETRLDVKGLLCPLPVLEAGKVAARMTKGERLLVVGDDPMMEIDFPHWCYQKKHRLVSLSVDQGEIRVVVEIAGAMEDRRLTRER